ncbi:MAG TPA: DUF6789 family protein [Longimicrobium sp.]|jgi:hypothetical protein
MSRAIGGEETLRVRKTPGPGPRRILAAAALSTGAALLVFFLTHLSLALALVATGSLAAGSARHVWVRLAPAARREAAHRARAGLLAGALATAAYDGVRFLLVRMGDLSIRPFETFRLFGELLTGSARSSNAALAAGTAYHLANGVAFAVAYALLLGERGWAYGLAWAMGLEVLMVTFYPGWLHLKALPEFLGVSILGHVAYGVVLGSCARRAIRGTRAGGAA